MLLTEHGLNLQAFDTTMNRLLGHHAGKIGANLLVEAYIHQHMRVELWDWFYLLLKAPVKTAVRRKFIESLGMDVERFIAYLEAAFDLSEECKGPPPSRSSADYSFPRCGADA